MNSTFLELKIILEMISFDIHILEAKTVLEPFAIKITQVEDLIFYKILETKPFYLLF